MKWDKAIKHIEFGLADGRDVEIRYHRKWMTNDVHYDKVTDVSEYDWQGKTCKVINTLYDQIDGEIHIVDFVRIEW